MIKQFIKFSALIGAISFSSLTFSANIGDSVQPFELPNATNTQFFNNQTYEGKVVYIDFWASWCPPCKKSFPELDGLYKELKVRGFEIIAINADEDRAELEKFLAKNPVSFKIALDPEGSSLGANDVKGMPTGLVVDKKGVIRHIHEGFPDGAIDKIRNEVITLLGE